MSNFSLFGVSSDLTLAAPPKPSPQVSDKYKQMISQLDASQQCVVGAPQEDSMRVTAGPGSGKTRVIISRAIKLVVEDKVEPTSIVLITFTNKAARELKERYLAFFDEFMGKDSIIPTPHISTIHSFCLSQIRRTFGFPRTILSEYQSKKMFKEICKSYSKKFNIEDMKTEVLNALYERQQKMVASLEILYSVIPLFKHNGVLDRIVFQRDIQSTPLWGKLKNLPYPQLSAILNGRVEHQNPEERVASYLRLTPLNNRMWEEILKKFLEEKYKNINLDFSDMGFQFLMFMVQHPELQAKVHKKYRHFCMDESQDCDCLQVATMFYADRDTYLKFITK